jgi:hypothetical protein
MRTPDEIVARIIARRLRDPLGFEINEYVLALDYEHARAFIRPETVAKDWGAPSYQSDEVVLERMQTYVDFAYEKINDERGISAHRSIGHYIAWLYLVGNDELRAWVEKEVDTNYHSYGRHIMDRIVTAYGWIPSRPFEQSSYDGPAHHEIMADFYRAFLKSSGKADSPATQLEFNKTAERFSTGQVIEFGSGAAAAAADRDAPHVESKR